MYKFRTMTDERDGDGQLLPDAERLTTFGRMLRSTSLDELPELWNILKGNMSIVGPRPLLVEYLDRYNEEQHRRHDVRPGMTGWAQVHGRNSLSWEARFAYDVEYVRRVSFFLDARIIFLTVAVILRRQGIHSVNSETQEMFLGTREDAVVR